MAAPALVYDPRYHTFESWSALMCEGYAAQQLQIGVAEDKWKDWATGLMAIDVFQNESIPSPYLFNDWQEWAEILVNAINSKN
jgi:hypothetical protein